MLLRHPRGPSHTEAGDAMQMGDGCELDVQSAAAFAQRSEELSYWQLQVRTSRLGACPLHQPDGTWSYHLYPDTRALLHSPDFLFIKPLRHLQARAQSVGRILFGFYAVPDSSSVPIDFVINLEGNEERSKKR